MSSSESAALLAAVAAAAGVAFITLGLWRLWPTLAQRSRTRRRVGAFIAGAGGEVHVVPQNPFSDRVVRPLLSTAGRPLTRVAPTVFLESTGKQLIAAGEPLGLSAVEFFGIRLGLGLLGLLVGLALIALTEISALTIIAAVLLAVTGLVFPALALGSAVRSRQKLLLRSLPSALDIMAVSMEAGLSLDASLAHVVRTFDEPLAGEFRRVLIEFQMGSRRSQAMRDMAERIGLDEMTRFVEAMVQADQLGVPYSRVVQTQAAEIRTRKRQRAEEVARVAPVKMVIPMVIFIFPALFIVVLGPAIPRMMSIFSSSQ